MANRPVFSETIIAPGTILYKGFDPKFKVGCESLLRDVRAFYLTDDLNRAKDYGVPCSFRVKKTLRLFDMSHKNIELLFKVGGLSNYAKSLIQIAFGTGVTIRQQVFALKRLTGDTNLPRATSAPGERSSYKDLDRKLDLILMKEFFSKVGYDGYYAAAKRTHFHGGKFPSEIMITNAYQKIERSGAIRLPVLSSRSLKFPQTISKLFLEYCRRRRTLTKNYKEFFIFCTGGQALNLYLHRVKGHRVPEVVRKTADFDLSFAVKDTLSSTIDVVKRIELMRNIMIRHMNGFINFINEHYRGANAKLRVTRVYRALTTHPAVQVPATNRRVYSVFTWQVVIGKTTIDVADTALAVYPGISADWILRDRDGVPIQKLKYQFRDLLALLSGSFMYPKQIISWRNPLKGVKKDKGLKNTIRVRSILNMVPRNSNTRDLLNVARPFVNRIINKNFKGAKGYASRIDALLKK
jgi:hypothetical protein